MRRVLIVYTHYFDFQSMAITIGGVQTYITNLVMLLATNGYHVEIFQYGSTEEETIFNNIRIKQFDLPEQESYIQLGKKILEQLKDDSDIVLFATDVIVPLNFKYQRTIAIQHGIYWDIPAEKKSIKKKIKNYLREMNQFKRVELVTKLVCVDYNFVNWYRANTNKIGTNIKVIPNFTKIPDVFPKHKKTINIIFARRFYWFRGTRVFANAIYKVLSENENVHVTIAGTGPDEMLLKKQLEVFSNKIEYTSYDSEDSIKIHSDKHIAVVPTVGSEGTSLSLLEAMSAQCAVICTNVGGLTNIIIDGYNGLMISPDNEDELYSAITKLIQNQEFRDQLRTNGYNTVKSGFSYEKWSGLWITVMDSFG